ncbi:MAG: hypothetical protein A2511_07495 [Deltaproteobacteria bacterium RIFOXYD12_FULL_50_9]|nr:MAG: hypothetical protein A2511_07495 [Deltaproteobacteria bacterium RIFOXYD12_FULL_50_9]
MKLKKKPASKESKKARIVTQKSEEAMIQGIIEGSPDAVGIAVIRLKCGCRKMAAVDQNGEPASKVIIYRDSAESICAECKQDNGSYIRVKESFIHWIEPAPGEYARAMIESKVFGTSPQVH